MLLSYELFVRKFGLRKPGQLANPIINKEPDFAFPKNSIWHYTATDGSIGPAQSDPLLEGIKRVIPIYHVTELAYKEGDPRIMPSQPQQWIRHYHQQNRRIKRVYEHKAGTKDVLVPYIVSYAMIDRRYRYIKNVYADYNRWINLQKTILTEVDKIASETEAQNFIFLDLPKILPNISILRQASKQMNLNVMKKFDGNDAFMIFEFWKWVGDSRQDSILNLINEKNYHKVNFVFRDSGNWVTFNLGKVNSWRMTTEEEIKANAEMTPITKGLPFKKVRLLFLRYLMSLNSARLGGEDLLDSLDEQLSNDENVITNAPVEDNEETEKDLGLSEDDVKDDDEVKVTETVGASPKPITGKDKTITKTTNTISKKEKLSKAPNAYDDDDADDIDVFDDQVMEEIEKDIEAMDKMSESISDKQDEDNERPVGGYVSLKANDVSTPEESVMVEVNKLAETGMLSAAEFRRFEELGKRYKEIKYPGTNKTLEEVAKIDKEKLKLSEPKKFKDNKVVFDKSMLESSIHEFDTKYVNEVMESDLASMVLSMQKAGICVTDVEKERIEDASGQYDQMRIKVQPVEGAASTLWLKLPVIDDEGYFTTNGTKYRMRKQRADLPIHKVAPDKVSLTSYYGKANVFRSHKKVTDYAEWLRNSIMSKGLDLEDDTVEDLKPSNSFYQDVKAPRLYTLLSMRFQSFKLGGYTWYLDYKQHNTIFSTKEMEDWEKDGSILVGKSDKGDLLLMSDDGSLSTIKKVGPVDQKMPAPSIEDMLGLERLKAPVDITSVKVLGKIIPIGFILAYELGLEKLINSLGVNYRRVPKDNRLDMQPDEWRLVFGDESLIFSRKDKVASMILAGLRDFHLELKKYSVYEFDRKDVYLNLLEAVGLSTRYLREIDLMYKMFIDPITKDILEEMHEPTTFTGLLIRATELLLTDDHPDEVDPQYMRIRGFERIPGAVYTELVKAIRVQNSRVGKSKVPIDLNPFAVWRTITTDPAVIVSKEINPIENLKEMEAVTYGGNGGRTGQTMMKHTRVYHKNDLGAISEATVDSSDVGINIYLSTNPNFTSVRGLTKPIDKNNVKPSSVFSTSFLLAPGVDRDDTKRANFVNIQNSHTMACEGYHVLPVRTGQESVIANRVGDLYAYVAKGNGKITKLTPDAVQITYEDGTVKGIEIGRRFTSASGITIPHEVVCRFKEGDKIKEGDVVTYNTGYFERDPLQPDSIAYKAGLLANVVVYETNLTDEDSSTVSRRLASRLKTSIAKPRDIILEFNQGISHLVKVGESVEPTDILCLIEDSVSSNTDAFDRTSLDTLKLLGSQTPTAKVKGIVERIEVFYHGDKEDMSESLRKIANAADKERINRLKAMGKTPVTGQVDAGFRIEGESLLPDTLLIRVYITSNVILDSGDKIVFANQMKSVIGKVMDEPIIAEDGEEIDAEFGRRSIAARIVNSPDIIGTTTTLLEVIGKKAFEIYNK